MDIADVKAFHRRHSIMLDTAIVGGGLCGLALANTLPDDPRRNRLFEARSRLGGRILSVPCPTAGMSMDLGPTWFWPDGQPRISQLLDTLGIGHFPQYDDGPVLSLSDPNEKPVATQLTNIHGGAHRVEGGMRSLVEALERRLAPGTVRLEHVLVAVEDRDDAVALTFRRPDSDLPLEVLARRVVLALPPRLLEECVTFSPALPDELMETMRTTHTWMAAQAKAAMGYRSAFWREAGLSGNAFVHHHQVVLGEVYDACDVDASHAGLAGFVALAPKTREHFLEGMPMLVSTQLSQLFGTQAQEGEFHYQDWSAEPFTCSALDRNPPAYHPQYAEPRLRQVYWNGKLHFGGSETAVYGGGYLEGALEAAGRIRMALAERPIRGAIA